MKAMLIRTPMKQMVFVLRFTVVRVSTARLQIVVDGGGIYRLERSVLGFLTDFDRAAEAGTVAATADQTGNYVVWCRMNVLDSLRG